MPIDVYINTNYGAWVRRLKAYIPQDYITDVLNSVLLSLLEREYPLTSLVHPDIYVINACKMAWYSKESAYSRQLKRHVHTIPLDEAPELMDEEPEEDEENNCVEIIHIIDESPFCWWEKELFKRKVLEDKTLKEMSADCNLTVGQVWYSYNKVRKYLQKKLEEYAKKEEN